MSLIRLLVLGVVRGHGEVHGYAVSRQLADWQIDSWTRVRPGSLYHALKQLTKEGKLASGAAEQSPEGPDRTLYRITSAGEAEFSNALEAALMSLDIEAIGVGLAFMTALPRGRVLDLFAQRQALARENHNRLQGMQAKRPLPSPPPHSGELMSLWAENLAVGMAWVDRLTERIEAGDYEFAAA